MIYYEQFSKINGKYYFMGWYPMLNELYCVDTKTRGKYIYKKYIFPDGSVEYIKYGGYIEK